MILKLYLNLPSDAAYVPIVRAVSTTLMSQLGVASQDIDDAAVVIGEICGNVVRHAHDDPRARYVVEIDYHTDYIDLTVRDRGRGFRRNEVPEPTLGRSGGWGLWLVENLAESVAFESAADGGTAARVRLNVRYRDQEGRRRAQRLDAPEGEACTATFSAPTP
jgi:anti-sigma regulatory factor (Ser/Thr protein kinase)